MLRKTSVLIREKWDERFVRAFWNCCACYALCFIKDIDIPVPLVTIGPASSGKSTLLDLFRSLPRIVWSDDFTPKAFVSHAAAFKESALEKIDLLPRIKDRCLVTSDLAPLFGQPKETLTQTLGLLTRIMDGHGLMTSSGIRGTRGYSGDYRFAWIAASTPIPPHVWVIMSKLGSRLLFQRVNGIKTFNLTNIREFPLILQIIRNGVKDAFKELNDSYVRTIESDEGGYPDNFLETLFYYAEIVSVLRPMPVISYASEKSDKTMAVQLESPTRVFTQFMNLAKGLRLVVGDDFDLIDECIREIASGSIPHFRHNILSRIVEFPGKDFTVPDLYIEKENKRALYDHIATFMAMGVVVSREMDFELSSTKRGEAVEYKKVGILSRMDTGWAAYFK